MRPLSQDLLLVARQRIDFYDVVQRFRTTAAGVDIRLDRRRRERRHSAQAWSGDERRHHERRALDVAGALQSVGWVFIDAADRR